MPKSKAQSFTCAFDVKAADEDSGIIEGYASTFNNVDLGGDMVMPGAFKKTIKESKGKFPILDSHDMRKQIGWNLEAREDSTGLWVRGQLDIVNNADARAKFSLIKMGLDINAKPGLSIGYIPIKWGFERDEENGEAYRKLQELQLLEYSPVAFPMNPEAMASAAKDLQDVLAVGGASEVEVVKKFVAMMQNEGFQLAQIKAALLEAAGEMDKPSDQIAHLFEQGMSKLTQKFQP